MSLIMDAIKKAQQLRLKELKRRPFPKGLEANIRRRNLRGNIIRIVAVSGGGILLLLFFLSSDFFPPFLTPYQNQKVDAPDLKEVKNVSEAIYDFYEPPKEFSPTSPMEINPPPKEIATPHEKKEEPLVKQTKTKKKRQKKGKPDLTIEAEMKQNQAFEGISSDSDPDQIERYQPTTESSVESTKEDSLVKTATPNKSKRSVDSSLEPETEKNDLPPMPISDQLAQKTPPTLPKQEVASEPTPMAMAKPLASEKTVAPDQTLANPMAAKRESEKHRPLALDVVIYFNQGVDFHRRRENLKAIQSYQKVVQLDPTYLEAYNNLGIVYQEIGNFDKALQAYQKAIEINPQYEKTFNNLGVLLLLKDRYIESIEAFQKALKINPNNIESHINLGILYKKRGQIDEAIACYHRALSLNPLNGETHYNIALLYEQLEKFDLAISHYQTFIQLCSKTHPELAAKVQRHLNYLMETEMNSK